MIFHHCIDLDCHSRNVHSLPDGHDTRFPWMLFHQCLRCRRHWFSCNRSCVTEGKQQRLSPFYMRIEQVRSHHHNCHKRQCSHNRVRLPSLPDANRQADLDELEQLVQQHEQTLLDQTAPSMDTPPSTDMDTDIDDTVDPHDVDDPFDQEEVAASSAGALISLDGEESWEDPNPTRDGDEVVELHDRDLHYQTATPVVESLTTTHQFNKHMVMGDAVAAASLLVARAALQNSTPTSSLLPLPNIMLFLYLAKLVLSTGRLELTNLAKVLSILVPYVNISARRSGRHFLVRFRTSGQ